MSEFELEQKEWTNYNSFLVILLSIYRFITLFNITYTTLILPQIAASFNIPSATIAAIFSIIGIGVLVSVFIRRLPDLWGRKPTLLVIGVINITCICIAALMTDLILHIIFRLLSGIFAVNTSNIIVAEEMPARFRGRVSGIIVSIGMSSAMLAGYLVTCNIMRMWRYYYLIVDIPAFIIFGILWLKMKETRRFKFGKKEKKESSIFGIFQRKYLRILILVSSILFMSQYIYSSGIKRYFTIFLFEEKGFNPFSFGLWQPFRNDAFIGILSTLSYIGSIIGYWLSGYFADRFGRKLTIYISTTIHLISQLFFIFGLNESVFILSLFFINMTFAIFHTCILVFSVEFWPTEQRSTASGWIFVFSSIAGVFGNLIVYYLASSYGWGFTFLILTVLPILLIIITVFIPETKQRVVEEILQTEIEQKFQ
ncbi:MAG: MFS transporter [Candidatus Hodarchaeota archaeon]